jgi:hypothetical protein
MPRRSNINAFNEERSRLTLPQLQYELGLLRKAKAKFENISGLADYLSARIGVARTTLTRTGSKYLPHLLRYQFLESGAAALPDLRNAPPEVLKTHITLQEVDIGQLRSEIKRLEAQVKRGAVPVETASGGAASLAHTFMLLLDVLQRAETFRVDLKQGVVWDKAAMTGDELVTTAERARAFCNWLRLQEHLPPFGQLVETAPRLLK